jgi:hypothetical protein
MRKRDSVRRVVKGGFTLFADKVLQVHRRQEILTQFSAMTRGISLGLVCAVTAACQNNPPVESAFTDLEGPSCSLVSEVQETGATVQRCPGTGNWRLLVLFDDDRMSVDVVTPQGTENPLDFWDTISPGFTTLGSQAEWRVRGQLPIALIVRVNALEEGKRKSYFAVSKVSESVSCVTHRIESGDSEQARQVADSALSAPCLTAR